MGMGLKVSLYKIKLVSPTVVSKGRTDRGFETETQIIPGQTIGGAVNRVLGYGFTASRLPKIVSSPAFLAHEGERMLPAYPFLYACRECGKFIKPEKEKLASLANSSIGQIAEKFIVSRCERGHLLRPMHPKLVSKKFDPLYTAESKTVSLVSVGMNRYTASSHTGLLFEYTALEPGVEFGVTLASVDGKDLPDRIDRLLIGRGTSRGFGRAECTKQCEIDCEQEMAKIWGKELPNRMVFYLISPMPLKALTERLDLKKTGSLFGVTELDGVLKVVADTDPMAYGRSIWLNTGWNVDVAGVGGRRSLVKCLAYGGLVVAEWLQKPSNPSLALSFIKYCGIPVIIDNAPFVGLCMMSTFIDDPLLEVC